MSTCFQVIRNKKQRQGIAGGQRRYEIYGLQETNVALTFIFPRQEVLRDVDPSDLRSLAPPQTLTYIVSPTIAVLLDLQTSSPVRVEVVHQ